MTGDLLTLSTREMDTVAILTRLAERRMTQAEAARCLDRSERQVRRLLRAFERDGPAGLADKRRGRPAPNRIPKAYREYVLGLVRERYRDFGPTFAGEKLEEYHDVRVATETLGQWMIAGGIWKTRAERRKRIQQPHHRLQVDAEFLERIPGTRKRLCQFTAIDDCTRIRVLRIYDARNQKTAIQIIDEVMRRLPFRVLVVQTDNGVEFQSEFRWHLEDLDVRHVYIRPRTPGLDGKVERSHRIDDEEFYQLLEDGPVRESILLFNKKLRQWEDYYN